MNALVPAPVTSLPDISARDTRGYGPTQALDLAASLATLTPHTQAAYRRQLAAFRIYCDACGWTVPMPDLLRPTVLEAWLAHRRQCGKSPETCKQGRTAILWAARQAKRAGLLNAMQLADLAGGDGDGRRWSAPGAMAECD